jgi:chaperone required for assembly of F1-ATPase
MRDVFEDIFARETLEPADPRDLARRNMRALRRRFFTAAGVAEGADGFAVTLDGRPVMTPGRHPLRVPRRAIAETIAQEWQAQGEYIDPVTMPTTRLANSIVEAVAAAPEPVAAGIVTYLGSDLVCYRAERPEGLVARQARHWDPVLAWARDRLRAAFVTATGVTFAPQPPEAVARAALAIPHEPWRLGAVHAVTTLTGSALIALMLAEGDIGAEAAWTAAHVDEDWNMEFWGRDELALQRRAYRHAEMAAAARVLAETSPA